ADLDNDGDLDILACNIGLNQRFKNLGGNAIVLLTNDFDQNGKVESIHCIKKEGKHFPIHQKNELVEQLPILKKRVLKFEDYASAAIEDMFSEEIIKRSIIHEVNEFRSGIFFNENGKFQFSPLPVEVQYSEQMAACLVDLNNDGWKDIVIGGNQYETKPEMGMHAASYGHVLLNKKDQSFEHLNHEQSGFYVKGQIRDIEKFTFKNLNYILVLRNNESAKVFKINDVNEIN
ncbi:MAG: hypothetical protein AAGK97_11575, partial [Bacteroidota bacterium]